MNIFNGFYPVSKNREFTVKVNYNNQSISLNPIFQSLVYPLYLSELCNESSVSYLIGGSGFSMLKWAFYKELISFSITKKSSVDCFTFHGTILGSDNEPMSKHLNNSIQTSDLMNILDEKEFLRYTLIRSISNNNIQIQLDKSLREYNKIKESLKNRKRRCFKA